MGLEELSPLDFAFRLGVIAGSMVDADLVDNEAQAIQIILERLIAKGHKIPVLVHFTDLAFTITAK